VYPLDVFRDLVSQFKNMLGTKKKEICVRIALNKKATKAEYTGPQGERRLLLSGNKNENRQLISELEKLGVSQSVVSPNADGKVPIPDQIESLRMLAEDAIRESDYIV
jgi:hypothetical protein